MTDNHGYDEPTLGSTSGWGSQLNSNFRDLDTDVEIRDADGNKGNYDPKDGAKFVATDTGAIYIGNGTSWELADMEVGSLNTESLVNDRQYTRAYDGSDADVRLDNAISNSATGDLIKLERGVSYLSRTITQSRRFSGTHLLPASPSAETEITGDWTLTNRIVLEHVSLRDGAIIVDNRFCHLHFIQVNSGNTVTINAGRTLLSHIGGAGSVVFDSSTSNNEIGVVDGNVTVTDNGNNSIL